MRALAAVAVLLLALLAGCASQPGGGPAFDGLYRYEDLGVRFAWAPGAIGSIESQDAVEVRLPDGFLWLREGAFSPAWTATSLEPGEPWSFLAPPGAHTVTIRVDGREATFDPAADGIRQDRWPTLFDGRNVWALSAHQEAEFPHREPGQPNYGRAIDHFTEYFQELGYETQTDPYGTRGLTLEGLACLPVRGGSLCPESLANVVAWKPGSREPDKVLFVGGAHFDVVNTTKHGAFDNTAGTVMVLEMARAMAPFDFGYTIMFGLWGGEENGILGSQFWIQTNPEMRARVLSYWNLDVVGMSWPAPLGRPDPVVIAAGPDLPGGLGGEAMGPAVDMLEFTRRLQQDWLGFPDMHEGEGGPYPVFHYEGVVSGQATGYAAVNAQSDHTPFMAAGIPAYFIFNGNTLDQPVRIHSERDTLDNMTKYAYFGQDFDIDASWPDLATYEAAKDALAQSWETVMWFPFYHAVLTDLGLHTPPTINP